MVEIFAVPGLGDEVAGGGVQLTQPYTGLDKRLGGLVRAADKVVYGGLLLGRLAAEPGAGHVAAIAVFHAAHVEQDAVALLQHGVVRLVVRVSGVRPEGDDRREARPLAAVGAELCVDKLGDLALGHADLDIVLRGLVDGVVDAGRLAHEALLLVVLAGAAVVDAVACQHDLHGGVGLHQRDQELGRPLLIDAQRLVGVDDGGNLRHGHVGVGVPDSLAGRVRHIEQLVQKQQGLALGGQVERQQTLIRLDGDAGQIPDAFGVTHDHLGQSLCAQCGTDTFNTLHFHGLLRPFIFLSPL